MKNEKLFINKYESTLDDMICGRQVNAYHGHSDFILFNQGRSLMSHEIYFACYSNVQSNEYVTNGFSNTINAKRKTWWRCLHLINFYYFNDL